MSNPQRFVVLVHVVSTYVAMRGGTSFVPQRMTAAEMEAQLPLRARREFRLRSTHGYIGANDLLAPLLT